MRHNETLKDADAKWRYILQKHWATFLSHVPEAQNEEAFIRQRIAEFVAAFPDKAPNTPVRWLRRRWRTFKDRLQRL
jgi:hypothetical protein